MMKNTEKNKNNRITQTIDFKETVITNFSGIYKNQNFYKNYAEEEISWTELSDLSGCNCYCDAEASDRIRKEIQAFTGKGLHFIDSGNYHYMTRLWLEKLQIPFRLLVFDNHTDMQPPAFGGLSGDLRMYTAYKNNTAEGQWGKWGDVRLVGNSDGIEAKFGAIGSNGSETDANAVAYADNLVWTSGTIVSGIISGAQASLIELSGSMQKGEGAGSEFWFEFTGNTEYLLEDGASIKLISWTDGNAPTDFLESEFKAADMGGKTAKFAIENDGLYVSYVVPEPAVAAAILGLFAMAFAVRRRK